MRRSRGVGRERGGEANQDGDPSADAGRWERFRAGAGARRHQHTVRERRKPIRTAPLHTTARARVHVLFNEARTRTRPYAWALRCSVGALFPCVSLYNIQSPPCNLRAVANSAATTWTRQCDGASTNAYTFLYRTSEHACTCLRCTSATPRML